jgi:hypothetical protein
MTTTASLESRVHKRASDRIAAVLVDFNPSPWLYEMLPNAGTRQLGHTMYAVGILGGEPAHERQKQRTGALMMAHTNVGVRLLSKIRGKAQVADYRQHLDNEALIRDALVRGAEAEAATDGPQTWLWARSLPRQSVANGEYVMGELQFLVRHRPSTGLT